MKTIQIAGKEYVEDDQGNITTPDGQIVVAAAERTKPEIYSRVVGYLRPVEAWNPGKQEEFRDRKPFAVHQEPAGACAAQTTPQEQTTG